MLWKGWEVPTNKVSVGKTMGVKKMQNSQSLQMTYKVNFLFQLGDRAIEFELRNMA